MKAHEQDYSQKEKAETRHRVISHAVASLTTERDSSPVVTAGEFDRTLDYCLRFLADHANAELAAEVEFARKEWHSLHRSRVGTKRAEDLNVLFLAGPDPRADLVAFREAGIPFTNIWAVESDPKTYQQAIRALQDAGIHLKVYPGGLKAFLTVVPQQFDIVYFDACGPLFSGPPSTSDVLRELFAMQRLSPLSVLINNFSEPCPNTNDRVAAKIQVESILRQHPECLGPEHMERLLAEASRCRPDSQQEAIDRSNILKWARLIGAWSFAHGDPETWTQDFDEYVASEVTPSLLEHYGRFTTEFTIRFAGQLLPWWRVVALKGARQEYFNSAKILEKARLESEEAGKILGHPLNAALRYLRYAESIAEKENPASWRFLFKDRLDGTALSTAIENLSMIRNFLESRPGDALFPNRHLRDACNPNLVRVFENFRWFDQGEDIFCQEPLPHLLMDLLTGLYGYPYHTNTRKLERIVYKAKETVMFTDVFVLDQARYLYDFLPTLPFLENRLPLAHQLILRVCMDAIHRHAHFGCSDLFLGCDLASEGEEGFKYWTPPTRTPVGDHCPKF